MAEHTLIRNQQLFCTNCGGSHALNFPLGIDEMNKKIEAFNDLHGDCEKTWEEPKADQSKTVRERAIWWFSKGEVGLSSKVMCTFFLTGGIAGIFPHYPHDPDDFGRCYKLLEAIPEWKEELPDLATLSEPWSKLVENWDTLTEMYEQNVAEDWKNVDEVGMYELMQKLTTV